LKPVQVAGSVVSRATLHNEDEINRLGLKIGDTVILQKAGDIIPDIIEVLTKMRDGKEKEFHMPVVCPACGSPVIRKTGEAAHRCSNPDCFAQTREKLYHFVSKKAFDIDGLGPKIMDQLLDVGLIKDASDIFTLTKGDLKPLERFAEKSADNLIQSIEDSKKISLPKFLFALGIRNVGEETAIRLSQFPISNFQFPNKSQISITKRNFITTFQSLTVDNLSEVDDIGPIVGKSICDYFHDEKNIELIENLFKNGVEIEIESRSKNQELSKEFQNKIFVLTGGLESMSREEAKAKVRELGGQVSSSVSVRTDYVIAGSDPGSKYDKAKKLGVKIIDEEEFLDLLR